LAVVASAHDPVATSPSASALAPSARQAAAIVDAFHAALRRGDTSTAQAVLAEDALIFEAGGVERGRAEYASEHLGADAAFSKAVPAVVTRRAGSAVGSLAWIATEGRTAGAYKGRAIDQVTTETMVLRRAAKGWRIVHIHWSSASAEKR
jgi:ketosteroid isomerase-like protein